MSGRQSDEWVFVGRHAGKTDAMWTAITDALLAGEIVVIAALPVGASVEEVEP